MPGYSAHMAGGDEAVSIFDKFGIHVGAFARLKSGRGVVGRLAQVLIVAVVVIGGIALKLSDPTHLLWVIGIITALVILVVAALLVWAERNPQLAVMEGLDLAAYKQAEA